MKKIEGNKIAEEIIGRLMELSTPQKSLMAISVGENKASNSFLKQKEIAAKTLGVVFQIRQLGEDKLIEKIEEITRDEDIGGIIIQLPLPEGVDTENIIELIPESLDVDALRGGTSVLSPSVEVIREILQRENILLENKVVAVVGRGRLVGAPISKYLENRCKELILIDERDDINDVSNADIVITGTGEVGIINGGILKEGASVIDFGYGRNEEGIKGDLNLNENLSKLSFYTPTPGGTGPILVAKLFENFYKLCEAY